MWPCYLAGVLSVIWQIFSLRLIGISEGGVGISEGYVGISKCVGSSGANLPSVCLPSISAWVIKSTLS